MIFSMRLKELRKEKLLTQQDLADVLQVGRPTIAGYETKNKQPDFIKLLQLAVFFDVSIDYLLGKTEIKNINNINFRPDEDEILKVYNSLTDRNQAALIERGYTLLEMQNTAPSDEKRELSKITGKGTA